MIIVITSHFYHTLEWSEIIIKDDLLVGIWELVYVGLIELMTHVVGVIVLGLCQLVNAESDLRHLVLVIKLTSDVSVDLLFAPH